MTYAWSWKASGLHPRFWPKIAWGIIFGKKIAALKDEKKGIFSVPRPTNHHSYLFNLPGLFFKSVGHFVRSGWAFCSLLFGVVLCKHCLALCSLWLSSFVHSV